LFKININDSIAPTSPTEPKMEPFKPKKWLTKSRISKNVHLSSNYAKIYFNLWTPTSVLKTRENLFRFKMAIVLKMAAWFHSKK
jgi:hypothetical protein